MAVTLRARVATFALFAMFLIPFGMSSLRGLTHIISCEAPTATPFTMTIADGGQPVITTSMRQSSEDPEGLCGGLAVDMRARLVGPDAVRMILLVDNASPSMWAGTIKLDLDRGGGDLQVPVDLGRLEAGKSGTAEIPLRLAPGETSLDGSILIGP
ncbi:MAG: hypothetical protein ACRDJO_05350 [Actinomycetota bacterium]